MPIAKQRQQNNYKVLQQKMANRIDQIPRSIKFTEKSIKNFVKGSSFLNVTNLSVPQNFYSEEKIVYPKIYNNPNPRVIGFDFYNKANLLLKECNVQDIQYIQKNPIIYQEQIIVINDKPQSYKNLLSPKNDKGESVNKAKTMKDFYKNNDQGNQNIQKKSKQAELNQFLFNYRKQQEQKKNKRLKFLSQVEQKISNLQKEAASLEQEKVKQYQQLNNIIKISNDTSLYAKRADMLGKVNAVLHQFEGEERVMKSPKKISEEMGLLEINLAIEQQHQYNDALLDQIQKVSRSKSKDRLRINNSQKLDISPKKVQKKNQNQNSQNYHSSMSKTLKRPINAPPRPASGSKKLISTWKDKK